MPLLEKKRILIVEDESHIAEGLKLNLMLHGYDVLVTEDGVSALQEWKRWQPDLIVLDIMLPGIDGFSVLQSMRLVDEKIPVLILSAKSDVENKIKGLSYGVDDYITKPFHLEEFILRVERLLKRVSWAHGQKDSEESLHASIPRVYTFGGNRIDFETSTAQCKAGNIRLTEQEVRLLKLFISQRGKPLSRSKILEISWGYTAKMTTRTVDNFIVRFRKYFEDNPHKPVFFKSLRSLGYVFDFDPS